MAWQNLQSSDGLGPIADASSNRPQLIFKHSTRCGISAAAKRRLENALDDLGQEMDLHYLDLIAHRDISNEIASRFSVHHESPQILLLRGGTAVLTLTHYDIEPAKILAAISA